MWTTFIYRGQLSTVLYSASWLAGPGWLGRVFKYLNYYAPLKEEIGFSTFYLADNGSALPHLIKIKALEPYLKTTIETHRFLESLFPGKELPNDYPYVWRAFYHIRALMAYYDKVIICDSDCFILSKRLANHIRDLKSGYHVMWSALAGYPATELSIICKDAYSDLEEWFDAKTWQERAQERKRFESEPPYTHIEKGFVGDRYGFDEVNIPQCKNMDWYSQAKNETELKFNWEL